jgi:hypothetical protein
MNALILDEVYSLEDRSLNIPSSRTAIPYLLDESVFQCGIPGQIHSSTISHNYAVIKDA